MKTKLTWKESVVVASMLFGLFFGAGNLIFPVSMGQQAGRAMWPAMIGFCLTGVGLPLLGIASMGISESKGLFHMSSKVGRGFAYFFTCALYLSIGPLFAIPRTATVSFQVGIAPLVTETQQRGALAIFSFLFFIVVLFFSLRPSGILTWIGKILNPVFLIFLGVLIVAAFIHPMGQISAAQVSSSYVGNSFFRGFLEGYNTMDALASLAFGIILIDVIRDLGVTEPGRISICTIRSGISTTIVMALIYCSLAMVGAQSSALLGVSADGGTALSLIAAYYFGDFGAVLLGVIITFACLKTSIGLVTACATTFSELFPRLFSYRIDAVIFAVFSFLISNAGLTSILKYSLPALLFLYPLTIVLILLCLIGRLFQYRRCVFVCTMTATVLAALLDLIVALPDAVKSWIPFGTAITAFAQSLPFAAISMGWVLPTAIGFLIGCIARKVIPAR